MLTLVLAGELHLFARPGFVSETEAEIFATGDFDGNGTIDVVVLNRATGHYRLGYQQTDGTLSWTRYKVTDLQDATGMAIGRILDLGTDAMVLAGADHQRLAAVDVSNPGGFFNARPIPAEVVGAGSVAAIDIGGPGNTPLDDLVVASHHTAEGSSAPWSCPPRKRLCHLFR